MYTFLGDGMRNTLILAVAVTSIGALSAQAGEMVLRNGVTWAGTFEGDVASPTGSTPAWAVFDIGNTNSESSDGDIRTYTTGNEAGKNSYGYAGPSWIGAGTTRTAEIRARVPANGQYEATDGQGSFIVGVGDALDFRFYAGKIAFNFSTGLSTILTMDTSVFHTYRVTYDQAADPQVNLYIDNNAVPAFSTNDQWFGDFDKLLFGDISSGGEAGQIDVDFISWTAGVHAPVVPEPTSLALIALGGLVLRRKSR